MYPTNMQTFLLQVQVNDYRAVYRIRLISASDFFGKPTWHSSEKYFVYVAEEKARLDLKKENDTSAYAYEPDFGDTFATPADTPLRHALLCLDLRDLTAVDVKQIEKYGSEVAFVQPVFSLDHKGSPSLFATGVSRLPDGRRLGILVRRSTPAYNRRTLSLMDMRYTGLRQSSDRNLPYHFGRG